MRPPLPGLPVGKRRLDGCQSATNLNASLVPCLSCLVHVRPPLPRLSDGKPPLDGYRNVTSFVTIYVPCLACLAHVSPALSAASFVEGYHPQLPGKSQ